jgi:hypothetical protein
MASQAQLREWIANTLAVRRMLAVGVTACAALSMGLWAWRHSIGGVALAITLGIAITGFWVTSSHLSEWRQQLRR